jgi:hypothetical protein
MTVETPAMGATARPDPAPARADRLRGLLGRIGPPHLMAIALVLGAGLSRLGPIVDPDVWWHLRTGRYILDHHGLPGRDPWSLVAQGHSWVAHEWLSQVFLTGTYDVLGLRGISAFRAVAVLALLGILAAQAFRRTTPYRALGITTLAVFASYGGWGERPQLLSFLLLVPAGVLARQAASSRLPWALLPLTWVWANLHGMWFLGPALVGAAALGTLVDRRASAIPAAARTFGVCAAALGTAMLTPNGPGLILEPLHVGQYAKYVTEWDAPSIHAIYGLAFFALLGVFVVTTARHAARIPWSDLLPVLFAAYLGISYIRTVAPAVVVLVPYVAAALGRPSTYRPARSPVVVNAVLCAVLVALGIGGAYTVVRETPVLPTHAPVAATAALERQPAPQRVINEYDLGGWLLWYAPTARPAVDGRTEIYDTAYLDDYFAALRMSGDDWQQTVRSLDANVALLRVGTPLVNGLEQILHWTTVYEDDTWIVLIPPPAAEHQP